MVDSQSSYPTTNDSTTDVPKHCKKCGKVLRDCWYYYSYKITHDSELDIDMDVLDGPYCYPCVRFSPTTAREEE